MRLPAPVSTVLVLTAIVLTVNVFALSGLITSGGLPAGVAHAQEKTPKSDAGTSPALEGADPKENGADGAGMPPGGAMPPDKRPKSKDVVGNYTLTGRNATGSTYKGFVAVSQTGDTYRVVWRIGRQTFVGTGILTGNVFSVAYNGGLAVYQFTSAGVRGRWALINARQISTEDWTRR